MSVRAATADDLTAIMAIERDSFRGDAWSEALMRAELVSEHTFYVVSEEAGRIVGYAGLRAPSGSSDADVQTIALADAARGRGRGRMLLHALLREAAARRIREVFLDVRDDNATARALYASEGFVEIGRRPGYYPDGPTDAVVMRLDLRGWQHARGADASNADSDRAATAPHPGGRTVPPLSAAPGAVRGEWCT